MSESSDLLVEIGTEEMPPTALRQLCAAFEESLGRLLEENHLAHAGSKGYAAPRRLAVLVKGVPLSQPDREVIKRGPALQAAFDEDGNPTRPAEGFANSCGVSVAELDQLETDKGSFLARRSVEAGKPATAIIPALVERALKGLPVPRRMRWGVGEEEFVRPVHWVLLLLGDQVVEADILGIHSGGTTRGHRFHCNETLTICRPNDYLKILEQPGHVLADMNRRREAIRTQITEAGAALGGTTRIDADLLDEVTALVEWPVAITGAFDERFLEVPAEALVSSMQDHQKFFPVVDSNGALLPHFITVANIASSDPQQVQAGNERVIRPRLEDAAFFWNQDRKVTLESRAENLAGVIFQQQLGSLGDKQRRIAAIATVIAETAGFNSAHVQRAAALCKCDLLTSMVFEFPELQGIMGRYYARHDAEPAEVAAALDEQYQPRYAGDDLPSTAPGQALAIADRLDTLAGIFAIGKPPTGDKDPFGLRRAALGVLRILVECQIDLDLTELIRTAVTNLPLFKSLDDIPDEFEYIIYDFMMERLRGYYLDSGYDIDEFEAVLARRPARPLDFDQRMRAVKAFRNLPESESLAAANKRIGNILRKAADLKIETYPAKIDAVLFKEPAEKELSNTIKELDNVVSPMFIKRDYTNALCKLAALQAPVDRFFDDVMVMDEDTALRDNRLALLSALSKLFLQVADISRLQN
ncbi:MAG: glycine--tRNA ligase subunit beta [Gammaproteobacteria bacterium]|nr:glycine--tRNA ligase subunit beta [Gammaproteobacteria bacterium]